MKSSTSYPLLKTFKTCKPKHYPFFVNGFYCLNTPIIQLCGQIESQIVIKTVTLTLFSLLFHTENQGSSISGSH